jgi:hypothetical protein
VIHCPNGSYSGRKHGFSTQSPTRYRAPRIWRSYGVGIGAYHMKLLISGHKFSWFVESVYQIPDVEE